MRIIFFGSDDFAATNLERLILKGQEVRACVTPPDRPKGRGLKVSPSPVKEAALKHRLPVLQPERLKDPEIENQLREYKSDIFVVIAYGKILPKAILEIPGLFAVNAHASLLPKYRGAAPINWAIINGEKETGVTLIRMNQAMDAGDIISQAKIIIDERDTSVTLKSKLADLSADCLIEMISGLENNRISFTPQPHLGVTYAPKLTKELGLIVWERTAKDIHNLARGLLPWPAAYTFCNGKIVKVLETALVTQESAAHFKPGQIINISRTGILVAAGKDALLLRKVHPEASRPMDAAGFAAGHKVKAGDSFE